MAGRNKQNAETFNKIFRNLTRRVTPDELRQRDQDNNRAKKEPLFHTPLKISKFKLLSKETRKWYLADPKGFSTWSKKWDEACGKLVRHSHSWSWDVVDKKITALLEQNREKLTDQFFESISRHIGEYAGKEPSAINRVEALLKKRQAKVTDRLISGSPWLPGTLIELTGFLNASSARWTAPEYSWAGWLIPASDQVWNGIMSAYERGERFANFSNISIPPDLEKFGSQAKILGLVTEQILLVGETDNFLYSWIRLIRVLVGNQMWVMILHPTLGADTLGKWVKIIQKPKLDDASNIKTIVTNINSDLKRALKHEARESHWAVVCKKPINTR